jgi:hypothetical protein
MAKRGKPIKNRVKPKSKLPKYEKRREQYHKDLPDTERNPDAKEDFDKVLKGLIELSPDEQKDDLD